MQDMGGATDLLCPRCKEDLLHHLNVSVFDRSEDAHSAVLTKVQNATVSIAVTDNRGNPSSRRDGIAIGFECEGGGGGKPDDFIELTIAQHKGSTEIGWRFTPKPNQL
jgi:hypothetical protein